jgi:hypothetical protein
MPTTTITFATGETITTAAAAWSDPSNALASDNSHATVALSAAAVSSEALRVTAGDFSAIPKGAIITAITVPVEAKYAGIGASAIITSARLVASGAVIGTLDGTNNALTESDATSIYTGADPLWGNTRILRLDLTATFGAQIVATFGAATPTVSVDHEYMTVAWRRAPSRSRQHARGRAQR